jgi:hypothetical protein
MFFLFRARAMLPDKFNFSFFFPTRSNFFFNIMFFFSRAFVAMTRTQPTEMDAALLAKLRGATLVPASSARVSSQGGGMD